MATKKKAAKTDPKSARIDQLLAARQLFDEQLRELGVEPAEESRRAPPSSIARAKVDADRIELYVQVMNKATLPGNKTRITLQTRQGKLYFWDATSNKGAALDRGEWYTLKARIVAHEGNVPILHYGLIQSVKPSRAAR